MKRIITITLLLCISSAYGSDSLKLAKTFPKVELKILTDTILHIQGTELDTFGFIPDIIFIVRDLNGQILPLQHYAPSLLIYGTRDHYAGYGNPKTSNAIQLNQEYHAGEKYTIRYFDQYLKAETDTFDFKTPVELDSLNGRTCVYEIQMGRDEWNSECTLQTTKKFSKKDKELIHQIFMNQDIYGILESERGNRFTREVIEKLGLTDKKRRRVWCYCNNTPVGN